MWMMGYNNDGSEFSMADSFNGRKLRPFATPRPTAVVSSANNISNVPSTAPPCFSRIHGTELFAINHHHLSHLAGEQSKKEYNTQSVVVSSRWNPTPEQLRALEDLYRRGTRTPSADQIQHITAQLRRFGKIEGKNVFYWFQNHKARERQKRRRQLEATDDDQCGDSEAIQKKESGESKVAIGFEVEQTKNWEPVPMHRPEEKTATAAECAADEGWTQFDEDGEIQLRRRTLTMTERNSTWQQSTQLYCAPPMSTSHLMTNTTTTNFTTVMTTVATLPLSSTLLTSSSSAANDPNPTTDDELTFYLPSHKHDQSPQGFQTLELFPLRSNNGDVMNESLVEDDDDDHEKKTTDLTASFQFIEFLPLKNN